VTPLGEAELLRVIENDPHQHGVESANWTTILLAAYLAQTTGIQVDPETVRRHHHQLGYVCKRPTWTMAHKAAEREDWVGNASG
jgi:transposase